MERKPLRLRPSNQEKTQEELAEKLQVERLLRNLQANGLDWDGENFRTKNGEIFEHNILEIVFPKKEGAKYYSWILETFKGCTIRTTRNVRHVAYSLDLKGFITKNQDKILDAIYQWGDGPGFYSLDYAITAEEAAEITRSVE